MVSAPDNWSVVVGIDGSEAAVVAALWAVDEAAHRDVPLRLVYVAGEPRPPSAPYAGNDVAIEYGESSLRAASSVVAATGKTIKVETEILWGAVTDALIAESQSAAMLCVGSVGIGWIAQRVLGSTAAAIAGDAECPVVIVRYPRVIQPRKHTSWVVVGVDNRRGNDELVRLALDQARLRRVAVLAVATWSSELSGVSYADLDRRVEKWRQDYPDLHFHSAATGGGLPEYVAENREHSIELVVLPAADVGQVSQIIGPHHRPLMPYGECSVMVVH